MSIVKYLLQMCSQMQTNCCRNKNFDRYPAKKLQMCNRMLQICCGFLTVWQGDVDSLISGCIL